ncbi:hypothetical protein HAP41_0000005370 [Bradyrhizobium barranii subsp. apii]|uniref:Uncharacterized protein n=1 Tax=Bradyrhizobium barranii subsp. apii TaxID=2819348 RepID=A0A8T5VRA2_9BRAD|nr:hypothetical protein [Bradyrhizobium barranii]UPT88521.1 hypothetical protein HAP41_0000005370 [Bradyrhizobium barranii subsp. apii]
MKAALFVLSLLGQPTIPISDRVPIFNVEALCRDVSADDKASGLTLAQDAGECVRDETIAQQQLSSTWLTVPGPARDSCEGEAAAGGIESYVDLLTCLQMAGWANPTPPPKPPLRGASKMRNAKNELQNELKN